MQYVPNESANAALAIVINLLDVLTEKGLLGERESRTVLTNAMDDLEGHSVSNTDARRVIIEIMKARYRRS